MAREDEFYWLQQHVKRTKGMGSSGKTIPKSDPGQKGGGVFSNEIEDEGGINKSFDYAGLISGVLDTGMNIFQSYANQREDRKKAEAASKAADAQHKYDQYQFEEEMALKKEMAADVRMRTFIEAQVQRGATLQDAYRMYVQALMNASEQANQFGKNTAQAAQSPIMGSTDAMARMGVRK